MDEPANQRRWVIRPPLSRSLATALPPSSPRPCHQHLRNAMFTAAFFSFTSSSAATQLPVRLPTGTDLIFCSSIERRRPAVIPLSRRRLQQVFHQVKRPGVSATAAADRRSGNRLMVKHQSVFVAEHNKVSESGLESFCR